MPSNFFVNKLLIHSIGISYERGPGISNNEIDLIIDRPFKQGRIAAACTGVVLATSPQSPRPFSLQRTLTRTCTDFIVPQ